MSVEERRSNSMDEVEPNDNFPAGMKVLLVDGDQTCLLVLEKMLRQCEYHVTTATLAKPALAMLRENRNKFDLMISSDQVPDMDGFELLEHVGLETDLPVILSGYGGTKNVMKGIIYGACDYLIKPVRIEELRNIWQHVIRKKSKGSAKMSVEERRNNSMDEVEPNDNFPAGMKVLLVDDDQTCLLVLERMLRHCEYHVTTATRAKPALAMLRENRNKFDLMISSDQVPDMDGFKLLEHVGLETDLPVILMSGNGDTKNVMKGITCGACDYLIKPVRIEELRNIWQHVTRKKSKGSSNPDNSENPRQGTSEGN